MFIPLYDGQALKTVRLQYVTLAIIAANVLIHVIGVPFAPTDGTAGALAYIILFHLGPHAAAAPNLSGYRWASLGVIIAVAGVTLRHYFGHAH